MFIKQKLFTVLLTSFLCLANSAVLLALEQKAAVSTKKTDLKKEYIEPFTGMKFVYVEGGCYEMGDLFGDGEIDERPVHEVCVDDLYFSKYEVTNTQFRNFAFETGYVTSAEKFGKVCPHTVTIVVINTLHINSKFLLASLHTHTARGRSYTTNTNS